MSSQKNVSQEDFEQAKVNIKALSEKPSDEALLMLYALYKQATNGDVSGEKPGFFDFVGTAKYAAWEKLKGLDQASAMNEYVKFVSDLGA